MKHFYIFAAVLFSAFAVAQNYNFVNSTATYSNLTGATSLNLGEIWDDPLYEIDLPFSVNINGFNTNTLLVSDSFLAAEVNFEVKQIVSPSGIDLIDRGDDGNVTLSPISYKIDGSAGSRIVKVEFNNVGSFYDDNLTMFMNFQVWLYETTNIIEYRYGPSSVTDAGTFYGGTGGGAIGITTINEASEEMTNSLFLAGTADSPTWVSQLSFIGGTPSNGRMYRFIPTSLGQDQFAKANIGIYPNPTAEVLTISGLTDSASYKIFDTTGKLLNSGNVTEAANTVDVGALQRGVYFIRFDSADAMKFVKL